MSSSSPVAPVGETLVPRGCEDLLIALAAVPDPRPTGARVHPTAYVLAVLVLAQACAGFESVSAAAQWAQAAPPQLLRRLGARPCPLTGRVTPPSEATVRRVAQGVDHTALEAAVAAWTHARLQPVQRAKQAGRAVAEPPLVVAVDGKTVRGARDHHDDADRAPHLLAAATHATTTRASVVLAQRRIPHKTNEIPEVAPLLEDLRAAGHDPAAAVFTLDALHTQTATAQLLQDNGAGYVMTIKANQPTLLNTVAATSWPAPNRASTRGHGRTSEHLIQTAPVPENIDFPGAAQVFRIIRHTGGLDGQRTTKEVVHGITNLTAEQADPDRIATLVRGHWSIENAVHWVRDVTFGEDASRVRRGNAPAVLATVRNIVITALRLAGAVNLAAARRAAALDPYAMLATLTRPANQDKASL